MFARGVSTFAAEYFYLFCAGVTIEYYVSALPTSVVIGHDKPNEVGCCDAM